MIQVCIEKILRHIFDSAMFRFILARQPSPGIVNENRSTLVCIKVSHLCLGSQGPSAYE